MSDEPITLVMVGDRIHVDGDPPKPVSLVRARPLTDPDIIAVLDAEGEEVVLLPSLDALDETSRALAERALELRYVMPRITRVARVETNFGTRYWWVDTDRGERRFALREPGRNVTWLSPTRVILRDTMGNRFEILESDALDSRSRRLIQSVL